MEQLTAAVSAQPGLLGLLQEAATLQVCGGCCLRLAAVRDPAAYSSVSLPESAEAAVQQLGTARDGWQGDVEVQANGEALQAAAKRQRLDAPDGAAHGSAAVAGTPEQQGLPAPGDTAPNRAKAACPLCLGLLQLAGSGVQCAFQLLTTHSTLNDAKRQAAVVASWGQGPGQDASSEGGTLPQVEAASASCAPVVTQRATPQASLAAAACAIAAEHEVGRFALEVSLPASLAVRQQALSWRLRQRQEGHGGDPLAGAVDLKEAVKLSYTAQLVAALGKPADPQADLRIALAVSYAEAAAECIWMAAPGGGGSGRKRNGRQRPQQQQQQQQQQADAPALTDALVQRLGAMPQAEFAAGCPPSAAQLLAPAAPAAVQLQARRRPTFVGGRYLKLRRGIPQSPWFIDGCRKGQGSVQEAIEAAVLPAFHADSYTMVAAGREDIDVRMLGAGRPFILEIQNARRSMPGAEAMQAMEAAVAKISDGGVAVHGLHAASSAQLAILKEGEQEKEKSYVAVCWLPRAPSLADMAKLESMGPLVVQQQTPIRVLHRRANLERQRVVHEMHAEPLPDAPPGYFALRLRTQAGTYVKEFVHGDLGRTHPSLGDLLSCAAQIVALDVTDIHMDFGGWLQQNIE